MFQAQNWKKLSAKEIQNLSLIERSRYLAYEPSPYINTIKACRQRVQQELTNKLEKLRQCNCLKAQEKARLKRDDILGHIKAAEAQMRIRDLQTTYQANRTSEISYLISSQQNALKSVRLQSLLLPTTKKIKLADVVCKQLRMRIEELMEDELGAATERILR